MFCPQCGKQNPDGARFCGGCGAELPQAKPTAGANQGAQAGKQTSAAAGAASKAVGAAAQVVASPKKHLPAIIIAAVIVVAVLVFGLTQCGGNKHASPDALASTLSTSMRHLYDGGLDDNAVRGFAEDVIELLPSEVVDRAIEEGDVEDKDELIEEVEDGFSGITGPSGLSSILDKVSIDVKMISGETLDEDYIDNVNERFQDDLGLDIEVTDAVALGIDITITAKEDVGILSAGESNTQSIDNSGISAIKVDGKWYLWMSVLNW